MVALIVLLLILALFGGLGFAAHILWIVLIAAVILWIVGFLIGGVESGAGATKVVSLVARARRAPSAAPRRRYAALPAPRLTSAGAARLAGLAGQLAQTLQRAAQQPRDLHLRDADPLGDLRLREILPEAQEQDLALALGQVLGGREDRRLVVDQPEPLDPRRRSRRCGVASSSPASGASSETVP